MSEKAKIIAGLVVFILLATSPIWYTLGASGGISPREDLELPPEGSQCVESKEWMAAHHMDLLDQWRDEVVRQGITEDYTSSDSGQTHKRSLTGTCMGCHEKRETFCQRCHSYANVEPPCWDCHLESKGN